MTNKKLGLLLLPLIPLSAIGIVAVASRIAPSTEVTHVEPVRPTVRASIVRPSVPPAPIVVPSAPSTTLDG